MEYKNNQREESKILLSNQKKIEQDCLDNYNTDILNINFRMRKNKRGQLPYNMMIFIFLFILSIIVGGIAMGTAMFFSSDYDFRKIDAELLNYKLKNCLEENEFDFSLPREQLEEKIYEVCSLVNLKEAQDFLIVIKFNGEEKFRAGAEDESSCILWNKNKAFPRCEPSTILKNGDEITIIAGASQDKKEEKI